MPTLAVNIVQVQLCPYFPTNAQYGKSIAKIIGNGGRLLKRLVVRTSLEKFNPLNLNIRTVSAVRGPYHNVQVRR